MSICTKCDKRNTCVDLCGKAEAYASQDHVSQRELPCNERRIEWRHNENVELGIPGVVDVSSYFSEGELCFPFLSRLQNKILHKFYFEGKSYKQIAISLSGNNKWAVSRRAVEAHLSRARAKIRGFFSINKEEERA